MATNIEEVRNVCEAWGLTVELHRDDNSVVRKFRQFFIKSSDMTPLAIRVTVDEQGRYLKMSAPADPTFVIKKEMAPMFLLACFLIKMSFRTLRFELIQKEDEVLINPYVEILLEDAPLAKEQFWEYFDTLTYCVGEVFEPIYRSLLDGNYKLDITKYGEHDFRELDDLLSELHTKTLQEALDRRRA